MLALDALWLRLDLLLSVDKGAPTEADAPFSEDLLLGPLHVVYGCRVWLLNPAFAASGLEL